HSVARRVIGFVLAPFDNTHSWMDDRILVPNVAALWMRTRLATELGTVWNSHGDGARMQTGIRPNVEGVKLPGYGRSGEGEFKTKVGAWSLLDGELAFSSSEGVVGVHLNTRTSLFGKYTQDIVDTPDGQIGFGRFIGAASAFEMDIRRLAVDTDQIDSFH